ncbi:MAG: heparinase [Bacteroidetes bacterium]|nr:heparinase [Bacteroidota bacterium]
MKQTIIALTTALAFATCAQGQPDSLTAKSSFGPHPRILFFQGEETEMAASIQADASWTRVHEAILREADRLLPIEPIKRIQIGRRLLDKSREAVRRIFQLSYAYRMTGKQAYADRAEREMLDIAGFSDWNPTHFLDVAEMTMAMAIGYDWLHGQLSDASRLAIRAAIIQKGLEPSLETRYNSWLKAEHNWNQVCNAGMTYGALAIEEHDPQLARAIINRAIRSIRIPMQDYGPDGIYPEGYGYWGYGTSFNVMFLSAVEKTFGTDFGLCNTPGFLQTAGFLQHMSGPTRKPFNYSDAGVGAGFHPAMVWIANRIQDPSVLWQEKQFLASTNASRLTADRLLPALFFWKGTIQMDAVRPPTETMWVGKGKNPIAMMRSSWTDSNAVYIATKGGSPSINHAHMDIGSFVMDAMGLRWAMDFGMQEYESLESKGVKLWGRTQDSERWTVFRINNFAHNTLVVDSQLQRVDGKGALTAHGARKGFQYAVLDLSSVYQGQLAAAARGLAIVDGRQVLVRDEWLSGDKTTNVRWNLLTAADVRITGPQEATLTLQGKTLRLVVESDVPIEMKTWPTDPPRSYDAPNPGTVLTGFIATLPPHTKASVRVHLLPGDAKKIKSAPLHTWEP